MTDTPEYRAANGDDAVGILTVLRDVAPEIPYRSAKRPCRP